VITPVAARFGWTGAFWFTGAVGIAWVAMWAWLSRRPGLSGRLTGEEKTSRHESRLAAKTGGPTLWAFLAAYALGGFPSAFILYQSSIYLSAVMHFSQVELGRVLWIPPLGWEVGYFFWGWILDRSPHMRSVFLVLTALSASGALIGLAGSAAAALALMFLAMFSAAGFIIGAVTYATRRYSMRYSGWIAGLGAGSWSALVALLMPGFGRLFDLREYAAAFALAAALPMLGCVIWTVLSRRDKCEVS